jgi:spore germination protein
MYIHVVSAGETITDIAKKYNVTIQSIITNNGLTNPGNLVIGQSLLILVPDIVHTVQQGETVYSIAKKYNTTSIEILQNNPSVVHRGWLYEGETIVIKYQTEKLRQIDVCGFVYAFIRRFLLKAEIPYLTYLILFEYGFNYDGSIIIPDDDELVQLAEDFNTGVLLSLTTIDETGIFVEEKTKKLLTDKSLQQTVLNNMLAVIKQKGAKGMDIDFEYIPPELKDNYIEFVQLSADVMHANGYIVNIDLAPKTSASQAGTLYEAHNYSVLGKIADTVFLMTYEWGHTRGQPMAVAPIDKVRKVLDYAVSEIEPKKMYLGIPNYAYDWALPYVKGKTLAQTLGNTAAIERAVYYGAEIQFDEKAMTPFYEYTAENGVKHIVWFEDVRSLQAKFSLINEYGLLGAGYWSVMRRFPANWMLLNAMYDIRKFD